MTLLEVYGTAYETMEKKGLIWSLKAMPYIKQYFGGKYDVYFKRRLYICLMLMNLHIPMDSRGLDVLVSTALCHYHPVDIVPENYTADMAGFFQNVKGVAELLEILMRERQGDEYYYHSVMENPEALVIRLTERSVLMENLYEYPYSDARGFIRETREHFFDMCIYAKENYREYLGPFSILMEKNRNLILANEAMLNLQEETERGLQMEILSYEEENAAIRAVIRDIRKNARRLE